MTQQVIPVQPIPSQTFPVMLGTQDCEIALQQMSTGLYASVLIGGEPIISGKYCNDRVNLIRQSYLGFDGWLYFVDTAPGSTGETQPLPAVIVETVSFWTADSTEITADSSVWTADGSLGDATSEQFTASVPVGLDPNYLGLGSRYILVYES